MNIDIDVARLRADRRARCLEQMDAHDLDVLVLGREANARFASGARRLWTAGTRPFAPGCVVVRASGDVHVLSTWDDGMPPELDRAHLYGTTWNPAILTSEVAAIPGIAHAHRIGVDGMTARAAALLAAVAPHAEVVDGTAAMWAARRHKSADEVECIRHAVAVAEAGIAAAADALRPGVRLRDLTGRYLEAMASQGVTTPLDEGTICVLDGDDGAARLLATDRPVAAGDVVVLAGGAVYEGYAGVVGRTHACPGAEPHAHADRWSEVRSSLLDGLRPGSPPPPFPRIRHIGLGLEGPIADGDVLEADMTLAIGNAYGRDTVLVTDDGPELLTRLPLT